MKSITLSAELEIENKIMFYGFCLVTNVDNSDCLYLWIELQNEFTTEIYYIDNKSGKSIYFI